jgi:hypothetical protein
MDLPLSDFCEHVTKLDKTNAEKAVAILWYHDRKTPDTAMTAGALTKIMGDHRVGTPNQTTLAKAIRRTKLCNENRQGFTLKPGSRRVIQGWLPTNIEGMQPEMSHAEGYLPEAVWSNTRGYIESVCKQLNGCFRAAYYDAASVMLRRLLETLIIEAYEHLKRESEIKDNGGTGNYYMLKDLVARANGNTPHTGLNLGRDAKKTLDDVKGRGDRSAHNRRYNAVAADLTEIRDGVRTTVQELIQIAALKK